MGETVDKKKNKKSEMYRKQSENREVIAKYHTLQPYIHPQLEWAIPSCTLQPQNIIPIPWRIGGWVGLFTWLDPYFQDLFSASIMLLGSGKGVRPL